MDKECLDGILENLVKAIEDAYRNLENLRNVLISLLAELQVAWACALRVLPDSI
jgi:hypothetical protein